MLSKKDCLFLLFGRPRPFLLEDDDDKVEVEDDDKVEVVDPDDKDDDGGEPVNDDDEVDDKDIIDEDEEIGRIFFLFTIMSEDSESVICRLEGDSIPVVDEESDRIFCRFLTKFAGLTTKSEDSEPVDMRSTDTLARLRDPELVDVEVDEDEE